MHPADSHYDIIFLGGGLASNLIARFLQKKNPDRKILVLEKNTEAHHNPGESTVGVTGLFMIRELGLSTYCYLNHLPKMDSDFSSEILQRTSTYHLVVK